MKKERMMDDDVQSDALHIGDSITLKAVVNDGFMSAEGAFNVFIHLISLNIAFTIAQLVS